MSWDEAAIDAITSNSVKELLAKTQRGDGARRGSGGAPPVSHSRALSPAALPAPSLSLCLARACGVSLDLPSGCHHRWLAP
jgi:hypothetical protein